MIIFVEELILKFIVWCLKIIDNLKEIIEGIFKKIPILKRSEEIDLINSFIENDTVK